MADELMATIDVMAYGCEVGVQINGQDIGLRGGKSASRRLFGRDDPMVAQLPAEMKNLACLKPGTNEIRVDYRRRPQEDSTGLTIEVRSLQQAGTDDCAFRFRAEPGAEDASASMTESFEL